MKNSLSHLNKAYEICQKETQQWAKTFYLGTLLLPYEKRKAIWAIYVWCRRTDEIMDSLEASTKSIVELSDNLNEWEENTKSVFKGKINSDSQCQIEFHKRCKEFLYNDSFSDKIICHQVGPHGNLVTKNLDLLNNIFGPIPDI